MNLKGKLKKLQTAILQTGLIIKINSNQFYSAEQKRIITMYQISTPTLQYSERKNKWIEKDFEILKTPSMVDVTLCLLDIYEAVKDE